MLELLKKSWQFIAGLLTALAAIFFLFKKPTVITTKEDPKTEEVVKLESEVSAINQQIQEVANKEDLTKEELAAKLNERFKND